MQVPPGRRPRALAFLAAAGIGIAAFASGRPPAPSIQGPSPGRETPHRASYDYGRDLFFHETFDGNGRTCATCHDPRNEFTMSPELAELRYRSDPGHPLFRAKDSDDGAGRDYTTLRTRAVFRVTIPLHPNVILPDRPGQRAITVWRGAPNVANLDLTAPYLQDGRAATLQDQALGAILGHMEPKRPPTSKELDALAAFEQELYYPLRLRAVQDDADPVPKPPGFSIPVVSPAAERGRAVFDLHCRTCHDGETLSLPSSPDAPRFASVFVSERNAPGFPMLHLAFRQPDGSLVETYTPDPGRAAVTGDLQDLNAFDIPSLRGLKHTAPYFHDNSAATLGDVIDHYNDHFQFQITPAERDDLLAFLELL